MSTVRKTGDRDPEAAAREQVLADVRAGLSAPQKELPPKYFYDHRGSGLFERITELPEYYPTRTERALLEACMPRWMAEVGARALVELGAGSAAKTRIVLDAMRRAGSAECYVPVDISAEFLEGTAAEVRVEYPGLTVSPVVADIADELRVPPTMPRPALFAFLGSTIGNFEPPAAAALLRRVGAAMRGDDRFLLGVDLRKDPAVIEAAYNDAQGVTAEFNRNLLRVINARVGADFDPDAFRHHAFYHRERHRVEMHLVAERPMRVVVPDAGEWEIREGESIRTEISCKHDRPSVTALLDEAGLRLSHWQTDADEMYALVLARR